MRQVEQWIMSVQPMMWFARGVKASGRLHELGTPAALL